MTAPRRILPGDTHLITRRCTQRQFLLRPDDTTEAIFSYCLAEAAQRFDIRVITWIALSNHYHAVVEDPNGVLPEFLAHFNKMMAKALNARWKRHENLWASEQASAVRLVDPNDVFDKSVYALANPTASDLVDSLVHWPGSSSLACLDGKQLTVRRPRVFFREKGEMPAEVTLTARAPTGWPGGINAWASSLRRALKEREASARAARLAARRTIVGRKAVLRASPFGQPSKPEPRGGLRPRLACKNADRRMRELAALRTFLRDYAAARARLLEATDVLFPAGTYKLVREGLARAVALDATTCGSSAPPR